MWVSEFEEQQPLERHCSPPSTSELEVRNLATNEHSMQQPSTSTRPLRTERTASGRIQAEKTREIESICMPRRFTTVCVACEKVVTMMCSKSLLRGFCIDINSSNDSLLTSWLLSNAGQLSVATQMCPPCLSKSNRCSRIRDDVSLTSASLSVSQP